MCRGLQRGDFCLPPRLGSLTWLAIHVGLYHPFIHHSLNTTDLSYFGPDMNGTVISHATDEDLCLYVAVYGYIHV